MSGKPRVAILISGRGSNMMSLIAAARGPEYPAEIALVVSNRPVHHVVPELDSGPVIARAEVPVLPGDTEASLAARVLAEEHRIYPEALAEVARALQA